MRRLLRAFGAGGALFGRYLKGSVSWGVLVFVLSQWPVPALAAWPGDPLLNLPVCTANGDQTQPAIAPDGAGGVFMTWTDRRYGACSQCGDLFGQHVAKDGIVSVAWQVNGNPICTADGFQGQSRVIADGMGGAIAAWADGRLTGAGIYVQRMDTAGTMQWTGEGVALTIPGGAGASRPAGCTDGAGGAIVAWEDWRDQHSPTDYLDIYARRVNAAGVPLWAPNGVGICTALGNQGSPKAISDGAGGAFVAWIDSRAGSGTSDIYAQHVDSVGTVLWKPNGVGICTAPGTQVAPALTRDGNGGLFVAWNDSRTNPFGDIYLQHVITSGSVDGAWPMDGLAVAADPNQGNGGPRLVSDGSGGVIIGWSSTKGGGSIFAQRGTAAGTLAWQPGGVQLMTGAFQGEPPMEAVSDSVGGLIVAWQDGPQFGSGVDVFAQRVDVSGDVRWGPTGVPISRAPQAQYMIALTADGAGGAIMAWQDARDYATDSTDIYCQNVNADGSLGGIVVPVLVSLVSGDAQGDRVQLIWEVVGAVGLEAVVERRTEQSAWQRLGFATPLGVSRLRYEDRGVTPGRRYGYRLSYEEGGHSIHGPETWVDVPAAPTLALEGLRPNPAANDLTVAFSLPSAQPATLELLDVTGRRLVSRDVGSLGPGSHLIRLQEGRPNRPGLYWLRLTQGSSSRSARAVIAR